jgi:L,D-transpeptidase catalytic domain
MPDLIGLLTHRDPDVFLARIRLVEQTKIDRGGTVGEERKIDSISRPGCAEGIGSTHPCLDRIHGVKSVPIHYAGALCNGIALPVAQEIGNDRVLSIRTMRARILIALLALAASALIYQFSPLRSRRVNRIVINKSTRTLITFHGDRKLKTYHVDLGRNPVGAKTEEGDLKTPEGTYSIDGHKADSDYHLALHISYPSTAYRARAEARSVPPGQDIEIHGWPNDFKSSGWRPSADWTAGCAALTNPEIEELYKVVRDGTTVEIRP